MTSTENQPKEKVSLKPPILIMEAINNLNEPDKIKDKVLQILNDQELLPGQIIRLASQDELDIDQAEYYLDTITDTETRESEEWQLVKTTILSHEHSAKTFLATMSIYLALLTVRQIETYPIVISMVKGFDQLPTKPFNITLPEEAIEKSYGNDFYQVFKYAQLYKQLEVLKQTGIPTEKVLDLILPKEPQDHYVRTLLEIVRKKKRLRSTQPKGGLIIINFLEMTSSTFTPEVLNILKEYTDEYLDYVTSGKVIAGQIKIFPKIAIKLQQRLLNTLPISPKT